MAVRCGVLRSAAVAASIATTTLGSAAAFAQTANELATARTLFASALKDEEDKHFDVALEKFRRVQAVKDTVPVRYRIGACLEGLARLKLALAAYEGAAQLGEADPQFAEIVSASRERIAELRARMPALTIRLAADAPADAEVELDHEKVPAQTLEKPIPLDPGPHEVSASAKGALPFRTQLTLTHGAHVSLVIPLEPKNGNDDPRDHAGDDPPVTSSSRRTWGWVTLGAGGVLLAGAGIVFLFRQSDIATLDAVCPGGACPKSRESELTSVRNRSLVEGPLSFVLAGTGIVAAGVGAFLLLGASPQPRTPVLGGYFTGNAGGAQLSGAF
jgi:hypothetical protein